MTPTYPGILDAIEPADPNTYAQALARHDTLTKPPGSLGELEPLGAQLAAIYRTPTPTITVKAIAVFAADHHIAHEHVSAYPQAVTAQMVHNFLQGGAAINALAHVAHADLLIVDVGVDAELPDHPKLLKRKVRAGACNFLHQRALTHAEATAAINVGIEAAQRQIDAGANLLAAGDMGIANTSPTAAITAAITGIDVDAVTGRGTGITEPQRRHKADVIARALDRHQPDPNAPLDLLTAFGGLDIAAITGYYLAAAAHHVPAVLDGPITTVAALLATQLDPGTRHYLIASHLSEEPAHQAQLDRLGLEPLLDLHLRLGEASGAALALPLIEAAARILTDMNTLQGAGVESPLPRDGMPPR